MRRLAQIAALLLALPAQAQDVSENYTAESMLKLCEGTVPNRDPELQSMVCTFRIQGVVAIMVENCLSIREGFVPVPILSSGVAPSKGAARQAFKNYMAANPDKWGLPWHHAVALAISQAFPCTE